ncbi:MAG: ubiquinol-cytochrome c reductase iron-sulfur subunit [Bacteroidales bacterium]|nr:ubiquinol-cytochrome c reductase iron-sulfur subunit [Bacteroidales bacterium]MCF8391548.1 ubiquinol-cytochrome c reductase iron-sulfur subunit [Bacteroidales bacterium]
MTNEIKTGRRSFIKRTWKWLGIAALAELTIFTFGMLRQGKKNDDKLNANLMDAGGVEDFPINSVTADRVNRYFLIRLEDGGFLALSIICSHLGCSVLWNKEKEQFLCPCHSSAFDKFGDVMNSPAPRALDYFPVIIESGKVLVDLSKKIQRRGFDKKQISYAI